MSHLEPTMSDRGFQNMPLVLGYRQRGSVRVYESSNAEEACIWVSVSDGAGREAIIQLDLNGVHDLAEQLLWLSDNHYQVDDEDGREVTERD